jgi:hypothetical protein
VEKKLNELEGRIKGGRLMFICPTSLLNPNDKDPDGHSILVPIHKSGIRKDLKTKSVWKKSGNSIDNITLHPSIDCTGSNTCNFHGWIKNGMVVW